MAAAAGFSQTASIRLHPEAEAAGAYIRLGEVAAWEGMEAADSARMEGIFLGEAPEDSKTLLLARDQVEQALRYWGIDTGRFVWTGEEIRVRRATKAHRRELLQRHLERSLEQRLEGAFRVRCLLSDKIDFSESRGTFGPLESVDGLLARDGEHPLKVRLSCGGEVVELAVRAELHGRRRIAAAARPILGGAEIAREDVVWIPSEEEGIVSFDELAEWEAARPIPQGERLRRTDLKPPVLVRKGEELTAWTGSGGGFRVTTPAQARGPGRRGETIAVWLPRAGRIARARVVGRACVEVVSAEGGNP
jgi:flagella basal body P-ring formation protein FlgA